MPEEAAYEKRVGTGKKIYTERRFLMAREFFSVALNYSSQIFSASRSAFSRKYGQLSRASFSRTRANQSLSESSTSTSFPLLILFPLPLSLANPFKNLQSVDEKIPRRPAASHCVMEPISSISFFKISIFSLTLKSRHLGLVDGIIVADEPHCELFTINGFSIANTRRNYCTFRCKI